MWDEAPERVRDGKQALEARLPQHASNEPLAAQDREVESVVLRECVELDQRRQSGGVDELQAPQVEDEDAGVVVHHAPELLLERLRAGQVELAGEPNDRRGEMPLG